MKEIDFLLIWRIIPTVACMLNKERAEWIKYEEMEKECEQEGTVRSNMMCHPPFTVFCVVVERFDLDKSGNENVM